MINESGTKIEEQESKEKALAYVVGDEVGSYKNGNFVPVSRPTPSPATEYITVEVDSTSLTTTSVTYAELRNEIEKHTPVYLIVNSNNIHVCSGYAAVSNDDTSDIKSVNLTLIWYDLQNFVFRAATVGVVDSVDPEGLQVVSIDTFNVTTTQPK